MVGATQTIPEGFTNIKDILGEILLSLERADGAPRDDDRARENYSSDDWHSASVRQGRAEKLLYRMICFDEGVPGLGVWTRNMDHVPPERLQPSAFRDSGWHNYASLGAGQIMALNSVEMARYDDQIMLVRESDWTTIRGHNIFEPGADVPLSFAIDGGADKRQIAPRRYQLQKKVPRNRAVLRIFLKYASANGYLRGGDNECSMEILYPRYEIRCGKEQVTTKPLKISAFKKWVKRFNEGDWPE